MRKKNDAGDDSLAEYVRKQGKEIPLERHELSEKFGDMPLSELLDLAENIRQNGLRNPILKFERKILDGWHRYLGCILVNVPPLFIEIEKPEDAAAVPDAENLFRRHLTKEQRLFLAVAEKDKYAKDAQARQHHKENDGGPSANLRGAPASKGKAAKFAADKFGVKERDVEKAVRVNKKGVEQLKKAAEKGELSIDAAAHIASLPEQEQYKALDGGKEAIAQAVKEARQGYKSPPEYSSVTELSDEERQAVRDALDGKRKGRICRPRVDQNIQGALRDARNSFGAHAKFLVLILGGK